MYITVLYTYYIRIKSKFKKNEKKNTRSIKNTIRRLTATFQFNFMKNPVSCLPLLLL